MIYYILYSTCRVGLSIAAFFEHAEGHAAGPKYAIVGIEK